MWAFHQAADTRSRSSEKLPNTIRFTRPVWIIVEAIFSMLFPVKAHDMFQREGAFLSKECDCTGGGNYGGCWHFSAASGNATCRFRTIHCGINWRMDVYGNHRILDSSKGGRYKLLVGVVGYYLLGLARILVFRNVRDVCVYFTLGVVFFIKHILYRSCCHTPPRAFHCGGGLQDHG